MHFYMDQSLQLDCGDTSRQTDTLHSLEIIVYHISYLFSKAINISSKHTTKLPLKNIKRQLFNNHPNNFQFQHSLLKILFHLA